MNKARWMFERLRSMPFREIPHRIRERSRIVREQLGLHQGPILPAAFLEKSLPSLPMGALSELSEQQRAQLLVDARQVCSGSFELLGVQRADPFAWGVTKWRGVLFFVATDAQQFLHNQHPKQRESAEASLLFWLQDVELVEWRFEESVSVELRDQICEW